MPFLKQSDYKNIIQAKKDGNPQATAIIQAYVKGSTQYDLDRMVHAFYNPTPANNAEEQEEDPINAEAVEAVNEAEAKADEPVEVPPTIPVGNNIDPKVIAPVVEPEQTTDISALLDADLDGLIDEDEIDDCTFEDFLADKKKNANRILKDANHFKMYDPAGRESYLVAKCGEYDKSFDTKRRDIERAFKDMDNAIASYSQSLTDTVPDDGIELNSDVTNKAYSDIVEASNGSHAFGRAWDDEDTAEMVAILNDLVGTHGKANVLAALNVIRGDNEAFRDRRNGQIDSAVKHYSKQLEDLLK